MVTRTGDFLGMWGEEVWQELRVVLEKIATIKNFRYQFSFLEEYLTLPLNLLSCDA